MCVNASVCVCVGVLVCEIRQQLTGSGCERERADSASQQTRYNYNILNSSVV